MKEELGKIKGEVTEIVEEWQELTPSVIGCYSSIAGQTSHITLLPLGTCHSHFYFQAVISVFISSPATTSQSARAPAAPAV